MRWRNHAMNLLRLPAVEAKTGLSKATIYRRVAEGKFPKPIRIGPTIVAWLDHEIDAVIEHLVAERDADEK